MYTKEDFLTAIENELLNHDLSAGLYSAGDPRFMQILQAMAQMLAMYSQQVELAMQEPFLKSRDATVLADAALKGLIFSVKPATVRIKISNQGNNAVKIESGRYLIDSVGRYYYTEYPVTVSANSLAEVSAVQLQNQVQTHQVEQSYPFYSVEVTQPEDGSFISTIAVKVNGELFTPSYKFNGVEKGDKVFHVESDEFKRLYVKFGESSVVGVQPNQGDNIEIECGLSFGNISPELESQFSLQYIQHNDENELKFEMLALEQAGTEQVDIATLRELCRYPSVYDDNAVFEGEFDKLLRKQFRHLAFLTVWNEQTEEKVRGANIENVNTLFYSFALADESNESIESVKNQIDEVIFNADNSYKTKYVTPVIEKVHCTIGAVIARAYDVAYVETQIQTVLLAEYGKNSSSTKQGKIVVKHKDITNLLNEKVPALSDSRADFSVIISNPNNNNPEVFRYMDIDTISINLTSENYDANIWGGGFSN